MEAFRDGRVQVLVASDLAARGLDISDIACVVNLEIPEDPHAYQHRAGRTGRAGVDGLTISLVDPAEEKRIVLRETEYRYCVEAIGVRQSHRLVGRGNIREADIET